MVKHQTRVMVAIFVLVDVLATNLAWVLSYYLRFYSAAAAGYNVKRVLVAGAGELGQTVAETILAHRELGYRVVGFVDDDPGRPGAGGLSVLGRLDDTMSVAVRHGVDQLYIALPLDEHAK